MIAGKGPTFHLPAFFPATRWHLLIVVLESLIAGGPGRSYILKRGGCVCRNLNFVFPKGRWVPCTPGGLFLKRRQGTFSRIDTNFLQLLLGFVTSLRSKGTPVNQQLNQRRWHAWPVPTVYSLWLRGWAGSCGRNVLKGHLGIPRSMCDSFVGWLSESVRHPQRFQDGVCWLPGRQDSDSGSRRDFCPVSCPHCCEPPACTATLNTSFSQAKCERLGLWEPW